MGYTNTIVRDDKTIVLTDSEVENIYRYQERRYRLQDARVHVNDHILRLTTRNDDYWNLDLNTVSDADLPENASAAVIKRFHTLLGFTDNDFESLSDEFQSRFDCNCDENTLWDSVINDYLKSNFAC